MKTELAGRYRLMATNAETGEERQLTGWFGNHILDGGLNRLGTGGVATHCYVGSGSTPPTDEDTALQTPVANTSSINGSDVTGTATSSPYYGYRRRKWRFAMGAAAGNLAEVGVGWSSGLFSRALILDVLGDPTTITVLSNEFLDVEYELRAYAPASDVSSTVTIAGVSTDVVMRASRVTTETNWSLEAMSDGVAFGITAGNSHSGFWNGAIGTVSQSPGGTEGDNGAAETTNAYVNNSYERTGYVLLGLDQYNLSGGLSAFQLLSKIGTFQFSMDPPIDKDNTKTFKLDFKVSWARRP